MKLKLWVALALILASLPCGAAPGDVSVSVNGEMLSDVVHTLSQQSGVPIRIDGDGTKPVRLNLESSLTKVLSLIGQQTGMTVTKEGDGYVLAARAAAQTPTRTGPRIDAAETIAKVKPSVALILAYVPTEQAFSQGTGFVVKPDLVVTNAHVIEGASVICVLFADDRIPEYYAAVAATDADRDLAVLRIAYEPKECLTLAPARSLREGDDVALTGFPMALELWRNGISIYASTAKATANAIRPGLSMVSKRTMEYIQIDAPVNPGYSGGPLYRLDNGQVVGVVQSKIAYDQAEDLGVSFAVPVEYLHLLITQARHNTVPAPTGNAAQKLADSIPSKVRLRQPAGTDPGLPPPAEAGPAITRPFDLLPAPDPAAVPDPPAPAGTVGLSAPGGKMAADPTRPRLYATDFGGNCVVVIDTANGSVVRRIFTGSKPHGLAVSPDGKTLFVANSGGSEIFVLDLENLQPVGVVPLSFRPFDIAFGPGGRIFATAAGGARASLHMIDLRRKLEMAVNGSAVAGGAMLAASGMGEALFAAERADAPAAIFEFQAPGRFAEAPIPDAGVLGANVQDMALSRDGSRLFLASLSLGYVTLFETATMRPLGQLDVGGTPTAVAVSPDGLTAYVAHRKSHVDCFDTRTFLRTGSIALPETPLRLALSADGKKLFAQVPAGIVIRDAVPGPPAPEN